MDNHQKTCIEHQCMDLVNRFAVYSDAMRYQDLVLLFTENARFARPTDPENYLTGRDDILRGLYGPTS